MEDNFYIMCLGSNLSEGFSILQKAIDEISSNYNVLKKTNIIKTKDVRENSEFTYFNIAIKIECRDDYINLKQKLKEIELKFGRVNNSSLVSLDIDIITHNYKIIHSDYYNYYYVRNLTNQLLTT